MAPRVRLREWGWTASLCIGGSSDGELRLQAAVAIARCASALERDGCIVWMWDIPAQRRWSDILRWSAPPSTST